MFFDIFSDFKMAYKAARNSRKAGSKIKLEKEISNIQTIGFLNTMEGNILWGCGENVYQPALDVFRKLPTETQKRLTFSPKDGEFCERVQFWKSKLKSAMPSAEYYIAIKAICQWCIYIKKTDL